MLKLVLRSIWLVLLVGAFAAFDSDRAEADTVLASWYGQELAGQLTASGEVFDPYGYTAAHKTLPLGTQLTVSYGGQSVQVTVNDRGPYSGGRDLDLSQGAAESLGLTNVGVDWVDYQVAGDEGYRYGSGGYAAEEARGVANRVERRQAPDLDTGYSTVSSEKSYAPDRYTPDRVDHGGGGTYVVHSGDTLTGIATDLGTTVHDLASDNGIANPNVISVGQTLSY